MVIGVVDRSHDTYTALHAAVAHCAAVVVAHDAAHTVGTSEGALGKDDILHDTARPEVAEDTQVTVGIAAARAADGDAAYCVALSVVGAIETVAIITDGNVGVVAGDVGGLLEGESLAVVAGIIHKTGEVQQVFFGGNLVGVVAQTVEVAEGDVANGVALIDRAGITARTVHSDAGGACAVAARIGERVIGALGERGAVVGYGGHWLYGAPVVDVLGVNAADCGVAARQGLVGHIVEIDVAEGLAKGDGDSDRVLVAAHRDRAARDRGVARSLDRGTVKPQRIAFNGHCELSHVNDIGG